MLLGPDKVSAEDLARERGGLEYARGIVDSASCTRVVLGFLDGAEREEFDDWCSVLAHDQLLDGAKDDIAALAESLAPRFPNIKKADDSLSLVERLQLARDN